MQATILELMRAGFAPTALERESGVLVSTAELQWALRRYGLRVYNCYDEAIDTMPKLVQTITDDWTAYMQSHYKSLCAMYDALHIDYKPLDNYNMTEHTTTSTDSNKTGTQETSGTQSHTGTDTRTATDTDTSKTTGTSTATRANTGTVSESTTADTTNKVAAYDASTTAVRDASTNTGSNTRTDDLSETATNNGEATTTRTVESKGTDNTTAKTDTSATVSTTDTDNTTSTQQLTRSGNIGVTTSQQMLTSELDLRVNNHLTYYICELFISQFTTW